jgi:tetratricopeptide (TPR) repeat protein
VNASFLEDVVKEIAETSRRAKGRGDPGPYAFVVGAGISTPSVPLASEIQRLCEEEAGRLGIAGEPQKLSAIERYSYWFMKAYPNAIEQQIYLQSLIEGKPATAANFRLAHLLLQSSVAKIVLTPNFDGFISKALAVFGHTGFRLCDHPETVERVDPEEKVIQIVHVHGTFRYYDLANLRPQIESRAEVSRSTSFTMLGLLDRILVNRSPIVVGYSGWDGDVIMTALKRRLNRRLRYRMFWFCFRRDSADSLPDWLRGHEDVVFVFPREPVRSAPAVVEEKAVASSSADLPDNTVIGPIPDERAGQSTLPAQDVFDGLIRELGLEAPELVRDPLGFFARQLDEAIPQSGLQGQELGDPYSLKSVVKRMEHAQRLERETTKETERSLENIRDAVRRSSYLEAIRVAKNVRSKDLDEGRSVELIRLMSLAITSTAKEMAEQLEAAEIVSLICRSLPEELQSADAARLLGETLNKKAEALKGLGRKEEAIRALDEAIEILSVRGDPSTLWRYWWALESRGVLLGEIGKSDDALAAFDETVQQASDSADPNGLRIAAWALKNKVDLLGKLNRIDEAILVADSSVERFGTSPDERMQPIVAWTMVSKADLLEEASRNEESLALRNEIWRRFRESTDGSVLLPTVWALHDKAKLLGKLGQSEEALVTTDELVGWLGESPSASIMYPAVSTLRIKASVLRRLNREEQSIVTIDLAISLGGESKDESVQYQVGSALLEKARVLRSLNRNEAAIAALDEVTTRFRGSSYPPLAEVVKQTETERAAIGAVDNQKAQSS